jgi:hypothetical protein
MRRVDRKLAAAFLTCLAAALTTRSASAAVWHWACQGELGDQRILFDRDGLYIGSGKDPAAKPVKATADSIREAIVFLKKGGNFTEFGPEEFNGGLESPITFSRADDNKQTQKVVFTERSSKRISHQHRIVACRDEDTDLYRKVYRYERGGESARDITMQCMEYQLSTRGGRKCD